MFSGQGKSGFRMTKLHADQVAVITGGASGIGFALAEALVRKGLRVALADQNRDALRAAADRLDKSGRSVLAVQTDVSDRDSMRSLRDNVVLHFGRADLVCNNAGIFSSVGPIWELDADHWRRLFEVNYWGVVHGIREFMPLLIKRGSGHVVNTASMSGLSIVAGTADYVSAKHAVVSLSEALRADLDAGGLQAIGVTVVCPGAVRTDFGDYALKLMNSKLNPKHRMTSTLQRHVLEVEELAQATVRGIEQDALFVTPTRGSRERVMSRLEPLLAAISKESGD